MRLENYQIEPYVEFLSVICRRLDDIWYNYIVVCILYTQTIVCIFEIIIYKLLEKNHWLF